MLIDDRMKGLAKLLDVAMLRAQVHAGNLANQNTPGYVTRKVEFDAAYRDALGNGDAAAAHRITPRVVEDRSGSFDNDGNNVSSHEEVAALAQNRVLYEAYVSALRGKGRLLTTAIRSQGG